jgi:hypothetical protein
MRQPVGFLHRHEVVPRAVTLAMIGSHASGATRARLGGVVGRLAAGVVHNLGVDNLAIRGGGCVGWRGKRLLN